MKPANKEGISPLKIKDYPVLNAFTSCPHSFIPPETIHNVKLPKKLELFSLDLASEAMPRGKIIGIATNLRTKDDTIIADLEISDGTALKMLKDDKNLGQSLSILLALESDAYSDTEQPTSFHPLFLFTSTCLSDKRALVPKEKAKRR